MSAVSLSRSSQPLVGISGSTCSEDEKLVRMILTTNPNNEELFIIDARPKVKKNWL